MDFVQIRHRARRGYIEVYPDFIVTRSKDLLVRGKSFYAIWDEELGLWNTDEYSVVRIIDKELEAYAEEYAKHSDDDISISKMSSYTSNSWVEFKKYLNSIDDSHIQLDTELTFLNTEVTKDTYASKRLSYPLQKGDHSAYTKLMTTLYNESELRKIEWAIGAIISGDARSIQKFIVLYGDAGSGKSTVLNIIQKLFEGYYTVFDAKLLGTSSAQFATEPFKNNPLVAIQHDGDLSRIDDNTRLNSIVSHEEMILNEKFKPSYSSKMNCFLFMATNKPVKITDAKSGLIRRLIDVCPSGKKIPPDEYYVIMNQINFELGAIAYHCLEVYRSLGKNFYDIYKPIDMMYKTDYFYNFVEDSYFDFSRGEGVSLQSAYARYKEYCANDGNATILMPRHAFREELKNYFQDFHDRVTLSDGTKVRSYFTGFLTSKFRDEEELIVELDLAPQMLKMESLREGEKSIFDAECRNCKAQYANTEEMPKRKWDNVTTTLDILDTSKLHYVKVPENHIVIDFDLKDESGEKSLERNLEAAAVWPKTYSELSKSGKGVHLHYIYDGDVSKLSRVYSDGIEVKVFTGNSSLRRKLSKCNNAPIATLNSGLPLRGDPVVNFEAVKNENAIRTLIRKNLAKEVHAATKPSIDFIYKILDDAYKSGMSYDVRDLRPSVMAFANNSTHQSDYCVKLVCKMQFKSDDVSDEPSDTYEDDRLTFFDVEVFPNLFVVVFKHPDEPCIKWINPTPEQIGELIKMKLIGFNNRRYDNHILYGRFIGYSIEDLYVLSKRLIENSKNAGFAEAYRLSYTDIYDFSSKKQSLKKFEIELGIHHSELGLDWDTAVPKDMWEMVSDYCVNDVIATEAVFNARHADFVAREILADLSGLTVNDTTQRHTAKIIFGNDPNPTDKFIYTDLSKEFPGYKYENGKSTYMGEETGEGGYVYAEPGAYGNVALLDISSMHPHSLIKLKLFGEEYTKRFEDVVEARVDIKHRDLDSARKRLDGKLSPYLENADDEYLDALAYALKIAINIVYGMTSAKFDNPFKDPRNVDNIVAKRGALFMIKLKHELQKRGCTVAHIKTDSVKIPGATAEDIQFVMDYGKQYGYSFEHEATYDKMCLVNNAVYIARYKDGKHAMEWTATGAQFQHPYVFKTLFSKETTDYRDICETKNVKTAMYLDYNEDLPEDEHDYRFVGKTGSFCPIKNGHGGAVLLREKDGKFSSVTGAKDWRWLETEKVEHDNLQADVDFDYGKRLVDNAVDEISQYCDFEWFAAPEPYDGVPF